jgi:hypothetical protein
LTVRHLMRASLATGLLSVFWAVISLSDPAYYDPQTLVDYTASILAEILFLAFAYTFVVWCRVTPVRRSALLLLGAAFGFVLWSVGNVLEEILRIGFGEWVYFVGAGIAIIMTALAGVITLTANSRWRWSGFVLLSIVASFLLEDVLLPFVPVPWIVFSFLLWRGVLDEPTHV